MRPELSVTPTLLASGRRCEHLNGEVGGSLAVHSRHVHAHTICPVAPPPPAAQGVMATVRAHFHTDEAAAVAAAAATRSSVLSGVALKF